METRNSKGGERPTVYRFGEFVLDVGRSALLNGNRLVPLRPKSYEVLKALLERPARLVSKRELLDIVWRNQVVSEDSLVHCITDIRRALNDQDRRLVRTVARRGYVLEAGVTRMDEVPAALALTHRRSPPHRDLWFRLAAALAVLAVGLMVPAVNDAIDEPDAADTRPAAAPSARLDYEFAEFLYQRRDPGDLARAGDRYRSALSADPAMAEAWAGVAATAYVRINELDEPRELLLQEMGDAVEQALAFGPDLAMNQLRACQYFRIIRELERAAGHCRRARELDSQSPRMLAYLAGLAADNGRIDEAIELQTAAVALDPVSAVQRNNLGFFLEAAGRFEDAREQWASVAELTPLRAAGYLAPNAYIELLLGDAGQALQGFLALPDSAERDQGLAMSYYALARDGEAESAFNRLATREYGIDGMLRLAEVFAWRGELGHAARLLGAIREQGLGELSPREQSDIRWRLRYSHFLDPLRDDSVFAGLLSGRRF